jgi:hypothetical protein
VLVRDSHIELSTALIAASIRDGLVLDGATRGTTHRISRVALVGNGVNGMRVEQAGTVVEVSRITATWTTPPVGSVGGDGIAIGDGATVSIDQDLAAEPSALGHGSTITDNARVGLLVVGRAARIRLAGARLCRNGGPGVVLHTGSRADQIARCVITANVGAGVVTMTGATIAELRANSITETRMGWIRVRPDAAATLALGDGVSLVDGSEPFAVIDNDIARNARFGVLATGVTVELSHNTGTDNEIGIGGYDARLEDDGSNMVTGRRPPPNDPPVILSDDIAAYCGVSARTFCP